jgi:hypothetical protein
MLNRRFVVGIGKMERCSRCKKRSSIQGERELCFLAFHRSFGDLTQPFIVLSFAQFEFEMFAFSRCLTPLKGFSYLGIRSLATRRAVQVRKFYNNSPRGALFGNDTATCSHVPEYHERKIGKGAPFQGDYMLSTSLALK